MPFPFSFFLSSHTQLIRNWVSGRAEREMGGGGSGWRGVCPFPLCYGREECEECVV